MPITPAIVRQLEPILLREPAGQPEKWLRAPQGKANEVFLAALRDFMYWENYDVRVRMDGKIDRVVLDDILEETESVSGERVAAELVPLTRLTVHP